MVVHVVLLVVEKQLNTDAISFCIECAYLSSSHYSQQLYREKTAMHFEKFSGDTVRLVTKGVDVYYGERSIRIFGCDVKKLFIFHILSSINHPYRWRTQIIEQHCS